MRIPIGGVLAGFRRLVLYGAGGVALTILVAFVLHLESRTDLEIWHTADLDEEFTEDSPERTLAGYLALEDRLFGQLGESVYSRVPSAGALVNRYARGSLAEPERWPVNWNRSFVLEADSPRAAVLLLHGLSDSPYSLRHVGERLHSEGAFVLGLRLPGHGTAPSGLVEVRWEDMAAAVELAISHLAQAAGDVPLHIIGYSNGAALAVNYALDTLQDERLPRPASLVLLSPAIGVTSAAAFAVWQARLGHWLGLDKLAWNSILPEYDPFKYNSFAVNAGDLSHRLTREIQRKLDRRERAGTPGELPPILAFASVVDATVLTAALVSNLFDRLSPGGHRLVLFDINRQAGVGPLLAWQPDDVLTRLVQDTDRPYSLHVVSNAAPDTSQVTVRCRETGTAEVSDEALGLAWPEGVFSLSHVALPFPPDDTLYGGQPAAPSPGVQLGKVAWRGERGVLQVTPSMMLRLRWNPFYAYQEDRIVAFLGLETGPGE